MYFKDYHIDVIKQQINACVNSLISKLKTNKSKFIYNIGFCPDAHMHKCFKVGFYVCCEVSN